MIRHYHRILYAMNRNAAFHDLMTLLNQDYMIPICKATIPDLVIPLNLMEVDFSIDL